jgi:hypothetical protein
MTMVLLDPSIYAKLTFILGATNIVGLILVFFSCRCLVSAGFISRMLERGWYRKFYNLHCYFWWLFIISVVLHAIIALSAYGIPF